MPVPTVRWMEETGDVLGTASHPTTVATDVMDGDHVRARHARHGRDAPKGADFGMTCGWGVDSTARPASPLNAIADGAGLSLTALAIENILWRRFMISITT